MKIVVLAGGLSPERNVSLSTGTMVTEALLSLPGHGALCGVTDDHSRSSSPPPQPEQSRHNAAARSSILFFTAFPPRCF